MSPRSEHLMSTQAGCNATTLATQESAWLMLAGHFIRSTFSTITLIQFLPQTLLNLLVIVSTLTTIYQSRVSCKPVFVFILNLALADFSLAVVVVVVANLRYQPGDLFLYTQTKCHIQMGVWIWMVWVSIFSIGMLTLDR